MPNINIQNLIFVYENRKKGEVVALNDLTCLFKNHSFNVIVGPSGCGKTTLLRIISGLEDEYEGDIFFDDKNALNLSPEERKVSYVTQNYTLYPHLTVFDNIAFPLKVRGAPREEIIKAVYNVADELDIKVCLSRKPKYLSGGQKQRVALAKSLIKHAEIFLFDEALTNVDPSMRAEQRTYIKKFIQMHGGIAIYVTHEFQEALALADELFVMEEGKIILSGKPEEIYRSHNELIEAFKKSLSFEIK